MTLNNWERNRCQPRLYLLPKIVQFLGHNPFSAEPKHTVGEKFKACRLTHGSSQRKFAAVLRIDPTTLANWEKRKNKPSAKLAAKLDKFISNPTVLLP